MWMMLSVVINYDYPNKRKVYIHRIGNNFNISICSHLIWIKFLSNLC